MLAEDLFFPLDRAKRAVPLFVDVSPAAWSFMSTDESVANLLILLSANVCITKNTDLRVHDLYKESEI